jgi:hypothetical protein
MKLLVVILLAILLLWMIRRNLLQIDLSFPLFAGIVVLGFASMSESFIDWIAFVLNIAVAPRAIILITIAILLAIVTFLAVAHSQLRRQQLLIVRHLAKTDLSQQEKSMQLNPGNIPPNTVAKRDDNS